MKYIIYHNVWFANKYTFVKGKNQRASNWHFSSWPKPSKLQAMQGRTIQVKIGFYYYLALAKIVHIGIGENRTH
jgi:hypothetical protein